MRITARGPVFAKSYSSGPFLSRGLPDHRVSAPDGSAAGGGGHDVTPALPLIPALPADPASVAAPPPPPLAPSERSSSQEAGAPIAAKTSRRARTLSRSHRVSFMRQV